MHLAACFFRFRGGRAEVVQITHHVLVDSLRRYVDFFQVLGLCALISTRAPYWFLLHHISTPTNICGDPYQHYSCASRLSLFLSLIFSFRALEYVVLQKFLPQLKLCFFSRCQRLRPHKGFGHDHSLPQYPTTYQQQPQSFVFSTHHFKRVFAVLSYFWILPSLRC